MLTIAQVNAILNTYPIKAIGSKGLYYVVAGSGTEEDPYLYEMIPAPSQMSVVYSDQSAGGNESTGRSESGTVHKNRVGTATKVALKWSNLTFKQGSELLKLFYPEYINMNYFDAMDGAFKTVEFYVGDRNVPMYNYSKGIWSEINFNIISRHLRSN